ELASRDRDTILRLLGLFGEFSQTLPAIFQLQDLVNLDLTMPLAEGGHGIIYKAIYKNQIICVKAVRMYHRQSAKAELAARAREIGLAAHLSHSNILPFLGSAVSSEKVPRMCFVFPWMENGNLVRYLKVHPEIHRIPLLHDIISALGFLHQNGIVHGSLKASKVLVSETGHAILADFIMSSRDQFSLITDFSNLSISVNWMAPELLVLKPRPTHASDIWAFGCVCYEVLTGLIPFHEYQTIPQVIRAVIKQEVPSKPSNDGWDELSEKAWSLMEECWKYGSDQRPNSEQLRDALSKFNLVDHRPSPMSPAHWVKKDGPKIDYARVIEILHEVLQSATTEP
ncbi:Serine/threonine-protein kinase HT1, partial [Leucoagaricus sp. SymC.cos]